MQQQSDEEIEREEREELSQALQSNDVARLLMLPIVHSLHHPDLEWVTQICVRLSAHPDSNVRGNAVLGFGHLARRFGELDERALPIVEKALLDEDRYVRGQAWAAADDLRHFLGWRFCVGTHIDQLIWSGRFAGREWRVRHLDWFAPGHRWNGLWILVFESTDGGPENSFTGSWSRSFLDAPEGWSDAAPDELMRALAALSPPDIPNPFETEAGQRSTSGGT